MSGDEATTLPPVTTTPKVCRAGFFLCGSGKCISKEWLCDSERDCEDASDEINCTLKKNKCFEAIGTSV